MATTVALVVWNQLELTRACLDGLRARPTPFDLCVVDNGSTDGTAEWFEEFPLPYALTYHRNARNLGLISALNQGASLAKRDVLSRNAALDIEGIRTVLALRGKFGTPPRTLGAPEKYVDLLYYEKAFGER